MRYTTLPRTANFAWSPSPLIAASSSSSSQSPSSQVKTRPEGKSALSDVYQNGPLLATGTASGALDSNYSNDSKLEIWSPFDLERSELRGSVIVTSRFNRIAWGAAAGLRSQGVIAAGMENSALEIWDPIKILEGQESEDCLVSKMGIHTGPVKGLDFNPIKPNLLASGAIKGEVFIWDLKHPAKPFAPPPSRSLDEVNSVSWNHVVQSVLAASSNNGYTVVWDIREANGQKGREVATLSYTGSVNPMAGYGQPPQVMMGGGQQYGSQWMGPAGGRPGSVSSVVWHPENPTKLATCSEDDGSPIVLVWDLRNARAPEKILAGHEKGVLNLSWCRMDSDLLVSCGKDCRTICWNPSSGEIVAELPPSSNWAFQADWCPKNPNLIATASFDGRIAIKSVQSTGVDQDAAQAQLATGPPADGSDIFGDQGILAMNSAKSAVSLKQAPKWQKRPAAATFAFGGKLVMFSTLPQTTGTGPEDQNARNSSVVTIKQVVTEPKLVERALRLETASEARNLQSLCEECANELSPQASETEVQSWKSLKTLFKTNSRDELITLLGFSKEGVRALVERQIETYKAAKTSTTLSREVSEAVLTPVVVENSHSDNGSIPREPLVTFADIPVEGLSVSSEGGGEAATSSVDAASSEVSVSAISEGNKLAEAESEITEPSLFGDDNANTGGQAAASLDFYSSMRNGRPAGLPDHVFSGIGGASSSVGATVGSRTSSVASESIRVNTFQIYPKDESKGDRLITKALVLGDFESAVSLCISTQRFADAILLGVKGGPELLQKAQKAYFEQQTAESPYLRLYQSIVFDDLADVAQNADLSEWQEVFAILCTFAKKEEFSSLAEQLGQRLEHFYNSDAAGDIEDRVSGSLEEYRKNSVLCYLAAGKLEKVVEIWAYQMKEEEKKLIKNLEVNDDKSRLSLHAEVLQTFIEKVTVFQNAINYIDLDLAQPTESSKVVESGARRYRLATLYDCYCEYAELLASQGLANTALRFIAQTPLDYGGSSSVFSSETRDRLAKYIGLTSIVTSSQPQPEQKTPTSTSIVAPLDRPFSEATLPAQNAYQNPYNPQAPQQGYPSNIYNPQSSSSRPEHNAPLNYSNSYGGAPYGQGPGNNSSYPPAQTASFLPPPPAPIGASQVSSRSSSNTQPPPPPASRQNHAPAGGWNDAPNVNQPRKSTAPPIGQKQVITSPFPNVARSMSPAQAQHYPGQPGGYYDQSNQYRQGSPGVSLPPPRANAGTPGLGVPPPPKVGQLAASVIPQTPPQHPQQGPYGPRSSIPGNVQPQLGGPYAPQPGQPQAQGYGPPPGKTNYPVQFNQPGAYGIQPGTQNPAQPSSYPATGPPQMYPQQQGNSLADQQAPYGIPGQVGANYPPRPGGFAQGPPDGQRAPKPPTPAPKAEPPKAKYPPGDRSHIPEGSKQIYTSLQHLMNQMRKALSVYPNQRKMVDDTERRLNVLFDALNCEIVPPAVVEELKDIVKAIESGNLQLALQLHVSLLTSGVKTEELTTYMPAIKMLINKLQQ
ncbi:hypothetical protein BY996DRAFT_4633921 [Phakopsora pachyrhizi]|uniref:Protein transport protein SEC31 n=1 Tax=Phakopsora pachyrhizi TaxID=170000 RepID=A0AAV0B5X1_PHAPC|nr:hypothetical protein BY996DRAFT_4633921 [Phakopsora pachyrhizi]CAH7678466.1 hypothetical protein PPACK8108_LOCUS12993 [Phakopsora pachyrhizi]